MTALPGEIEGAIAEGIEIVTLKAPASLNVGEDHKIHGIYATPQMISAIRDGRASVKPTGEPDVYIPCDVLIKAIGQDIESGHFEKAGIPVSRGKIVTLKSGAFENMPGVFAGGDCSSGPASCFASFSVMQFSTALKSQTRSQASRSVKFTRPHGGLSFRLASGISTPLVISWW